MSKFRSALRLIWSRSAERKAIIAAATRIGSRHPSIADPKGKYFDCPVCEREWPIQMADVDHEPPIGELHSIDELSDFTKRMYYGPQQVLCKLCHNKKTAAQRKKK